MSSRPLFRASRGTWQWFLLILVAAIGMSSLAGFLATPAEASHFRYGHSNWQPQPAVGPNTIDFTLQNAWRRDANPCVSTITNTTVPCTGLDGLPAIGDVIAEFTGNTQFDPGDGIAIFGSPQGPLYYVVTSIDPANNWLLGSALDENSLPLIDTTISHTYAAPGDYVAFIDSCCRISRSPFSSPNDHMNNPDGGYRVETVVNVGTQAANASPISTLPVIVLCPIDGPCTFQIPAADPNGNQLTYRLSTPTEASSFTSGPNSLGTQCTDFFCQPGPPFSTNAASVSSSGTYTWDTTGAEMSPSEPNTLYSSQVTVEDRDAVNNVMSKVAVDFFIQLVQSVGSPPQFDQPPTPTCGTTFNIQVNQNLTFTVQASDVDEGDVVTLNVIGLPPGATMSPPLPQMGNPVSSEFSFTPMAPGTFVVTFTATDQTLQQATCTFVINVIIQQPTPPSLEGRMNGGGSIIDAVFGRVTHGFSLECDLTKNPHNLQVNWRQPNGQNAKFHLEMQTGALCTDDQSIDPGKPAAAFDTYEGDGLGRYNGQPGAMAKWKFTDAGEPGKEDFMEIEVKDAMGNVVLTASGFLKSGNHQAH